MDTLLIDKTHAVDDRGLPVSVDGLREIIQRLLIRLSVRKGSFLPDPELGSELHRITPAAGEEADRLALHYAQQALLPERSARVTSARCRAGEQGELSVTLTVQIDKENYPLEVTCG